MFSKFAEQVGLYDFLAPEKKKSRSSEDSAPAQKQNTSFSDEELMKRRRLDAQLKAEREAAARGPKFFAKKQRVRYLNKLTNSVCDAVVVGVHFDDGPENPYYTIRYKKQCEEILDGGSKKTTVREVEKQTDPDRLSRVPWDEEAAWKVLQ